MSFAPSASNTTVLQVAAASTNAATDLGAAVAVDGASVPHSKLTTASGRLIATEQSLYFSSSQTGRLVMGASDVADPSTTGGQIIEANVLYEITITPAKRYFRFRNLSASTAADTAWTNPAKT